MGISDIVAGIFRPVADVIDHVLPSGDAKVQLQSKMLEGQIAAAQQLMEYQSQLMDAQSKIILAESASESWMARNWRPLVMLTFTGLIVARWMGWVAPHLSEQEYQSLWSIVQFGLGGYVVGRSAEKIIPSAVAAVTSAMKNGNGSK